MSESETYAIEQAARHREFVAREAFKAGVRAMREAAEHAFSAAPDATYSSRGVALIIHNLPEPQP